MQVGLQGVSSSDEKTSLGLKEDKKPAPARKFSKTSRRLSSKAGEGRRHLSVVDVNKPPSRSSVAEEDINVYDDDSSPVFAEDNANRDSNVKKVLLRSEGKKTVHDPSMKVCLPPATAILTSGPPDSATSTPPFPTTTVGIRSSPATPARPIASPDTQPRLLPAGVVNIELEDGLYEYAAEVIVYLRGLEQKFLLPEDFLDNNKVDGGMRAILVDWLVQVQHYLKLGQETLHICVRILDTVLDRREVEPGKLQLVGVSALLVASKIEEYYPADIKKLLHLTENSYSATEILHMEKVLFGVVDFQVYFTTPQDFFPRYTRAALRSEDPEFMKTCQLLLDSHLPSPSHACLAPSLLAAAAIYAASLLYNLAANPGACPTDNLWTPTLRHYTDYLEVEVSPVSLSMLDMFVNPKFTGTRIKYRSSSQHGRLVMAMHLKDQVVQRTRRFLQA